MQPSNFVKIKDPIYGYIEIEEDDDVKTIINSVLFHRLENVIQEAKQIIEKGIVKPCGGIYLTEKI